MPTTIIRVYNSNSGRYESNARVVLSFTGTFMNVGHTNPVNTDTNGQAVINHSSTGGAIVYVDGREVARIHTPTSKTISI